MTYNMGIFNYILGVLVFAVVGGFIGLLIGRRMYSNQAHEDTMKEFRDLIKARKHVVKNKASTHAEHSDQFKVALHRFNTNAIESH